MIVPTQMAIFLQWTRSFLQRSCKCSMKNIARGVRVRYNRRRWIDEIAKSSKRLQSDPAGFELWDTPDGRWWMPEGESYGLFLILAEQRSDIYRGEGVGVRPGDVVLDCGAHVGVFTRKALRAGARKVVAIEPVPITLECLRRNIAEERCRDCVVIYPKGVWDKDDFLAISDGTSGTRSFVEGGHSLAKMIQLPLTTIDKVAAELALDGVDFIKMGIEGAEGRALEGAKEVVGKYRPRLAIAGYHKSDDGETLPFIVSQLQPGYKWFFGPCYSTAGLRPEVVFFYY